MDEKLKLAGQAYKNGCTCSQAVFCAFAHDMGLDETTAYKIMEGFGGGFGAMQEVCGAFSAAAAVISFYTSSGSMDGKSKGKTYKARSAAPLKSMNRSMVLSVAGKSCMGTRRRLSSAE